MVCGAGLRGGGEEEGNGAAGVVMEGAVEVHAGADEFVIATGILIVSFHVWGAFVGGEPAQGAGEPAKDEAGEAAQLAGEIMLALEGHGALDHALKDAELLPAAGLEHGGEQIFAGFEGGEVLGGGLLPHGAGCGGGGGGDVQELMPAGGVALRLSVKGDDDGDAAGEIGLEGVFRIETTEEEEKV